MSNTKPLTREQFFTDPFLHYRFDQRDDWGNTRTMEVWGNTHSLPADSSQARA